MTQNSRPAVVSIPTAARPLFKPRAKPPVDGLALVYDVAGFTRFFNQPDAHRYVPRYLNRITQAISIIISGGNAYWTSQVKGGKTVPIIYSPLPYKLLQRKFLGDGELVIWRLDNPDDARVNSYLSYLINRLWGLQQKFEHVLDKARSELPVAQLPDRIRFSLARGDLYELQSADSKRAEYAGVCLNLASRLVKYCPELSFLASDRVEARDSKYSRVVARQIRGFPEEIVLVRTADYDELNEATKKRLFRDVATLSSSSPKRRNSKSTPPSEPVPTTP
jgi:hypothetical protein